MPGSDDAEEWTVTGFQPQRQQEIRIGSVRAHCMFIPLAAMAAAMLMVSGCATQAAKPVEGEQVVVEKPPDESSAADNGSSENSSSETVHIDPNVVSYDEYHDPLMPMNRFIFGFNDVVSRYALIPLGKGYARVVPDVVDRRVENFFYNVGSPIYAVNHLLQKEPADSGRSLLRFGINSTLGLLGLFDPAAAWFDLDRRENDFAATLAHYDAGYGAYLVLPFLGPSDLRNGTGRVVDYFLHPIPYVLDQPESSAVIAYGYFHDFAQDAESFERLRDQSDDPYIFMRNLHLQKIQRDAAYR
jgi:phospholipid-binding lipoprotein MlaA